MDDDNCNEVLKRIRDENREDISSARKQDRDVLLRRKRMGIDEVVLLGNHITQEEFQELVLRLKQKKPSLETVKAVRYNCCIATRAAIVLRTEGTLNTLIRLLVGSDAFLQLEAAACLINLVCGSHKASFRIAKAAGAYLVSFINSGSHFLQDQCAWAVGNIAHDCEKCFSLLQTQGVIPVLMSAVKSSSTAVVQSSIFALSACTKYGTVSLENLDYPQIIESITKILKVDNISQETIRDATSLMSNIFYLVVQRDQYIQQKDIEFVLNLLIKEVPKSHLEPTVLVYLSRCLGYATTLDSICQFLATSSDFSACTKRIFESDVHWLKLDILWILSNISICCDMIEILNMKMILDIIDASSHSTGSFLQTLYHLRTLGSRSDNINGIIRSQEAQSKILSYMHLISEDYRNIVESSMFA